MGVLARRRSPTAQSFLFTNDVILFVHRPGIQKFAKPSVHMRFSQTFLQPNLKEDGTPTAKLEMET
jgi:hypothetical protein